MRSSADPYLTAVDLTGGHGCSRIGQFGPTQKEIASIVEWAGRYAAVPFGLFLLFFGWAWCRNAQYCSYCSSNEMAAADYESAEPGQVAIPVSGTEEDAARANGKEPIDPCWC